MIQQTLTGSLGRDATMKALENNRNVINFSVAVNVGYKEKQRTLWIDCSYFTDRTGLTPYLLKGTKVHLIGQPDVRTFTKRDGTTAAVMTLVVREIELLGGKVSAGKEPMETPAGIATPSKQPIPDASEITEPIEDLPF